MIENYLLILIDHLTDEKGYIRKCQTARELYNTVLINFKVIYRRITGI